MRHRHWPLVLIIVGLGLLLIYVLSLFGEPEMRNRRQRGTAEPSPITSSESEDQAVVSIRQSPTMQAIQTTVLPLDELPLDESTPELPTPQPVVPTRTPSITQTPFTPVIEQMDVDLATVRGNSPCNYQDCLSRFGISGRREQIASAHQAGLRFGNYISWSSDVEPPELPGVQFWQMVNISDAGPLQSIRTLEEAIVANPGAIWIVGNEPDVIWQDNVPAERYAEIYHDVYLMIKQKDSSAQIAIAGVAQPTPLRLSYLDKVLNTYQALYNQTLPVDIWTVHGFILREEADSWGVGIPPGMDQLQGELYEISDHDDIKIFGQNLLAFRAWMAERGYGDKPLAVTEFGILHPRDYGFPPDVVVDFMVEALDFLMTVANENGYQADDNRLVQWWFWYSVYDGGDFPTGNLFDPMQNELTYLGEVYSSYIEGAQ